MNTYKTIRIYRLLFNLAGIVYLLLSCNENATDFKLGEEYIETQTQLNLIDTMSVKLSTVLLDTVPSSGTGRMLIGIHRDSDFGEIVSSSYFQIGIPASYDFETGDVYDSLKLVITYDQYSFGDTLKEQKILVHQLTENIDPDENGDLNADMTFGYNSEPLGSITYIPKPNSSDDTLAIHLSDETGMDLFTKIEEDAPIVGNTESFLDYFKGLVLIPDESYEGPIIGFGATSADARMLLYSHRPAETPEIIIHEFKLEDYASQFNHITHDYASTKINGLAKQREEISSSKTDGLAFLQGGTSLTIRIDFPSLDQILFLGRGSIVKAQLVVTPDVEFLNTNSLPTSLLLYPADKVNRIVTGNGAVSTSTLTIDQLYNENTEYLFNITDYLNEEIADSYIDPETGLMLTLSSGEQYNTFKRLILDGKSKNTKLKIYYLSY